MNRTAFHSAYSILLVSLTLTSIATYGQEQGTQTTAKPALDVLVAKIAEHESRYFPFRIAWRETYRIPGGLSEQERSNHPWADGRLHERQMLAVQTRPGSWLAQQAIIVDGQTESNYRRVCDDHGIHHFTDRGILSTSFEPHTEYPFQYVGALPLTGIFPLTMTWPSNGILLSEYLQEDMSRAELSWDGSDAVLTFTFGASDTFRNRYRLWLAAAHDWHPVRMQRFMDPDDAEFFEEWEATMFYHSTGGQQVRAGTVMYRHTFEDSNPLSAAVETQGADQAKPSSDAARHLNRAEEAEQKLPINLIIDFSVGDTSYGASVKQYPFSGGDDGMRSLREQLSMQLMEVEIELDQRASELGRNHPQIRQLQRKRDRIAATLNSSAEPVLADVDRPDSEVATDTTSRMSQDDQGLPSEPGKPRHNIDKAALTGCEMHVVGMYMPEDSHTDDRVYVEIRDTGRPMVVVMTGYFGAQWHLNIDPEADVRQIIVPGYYKHEISEPPPNVPISFLTYFPDTDREERLFFWAYAWHTSEGRELRRRLRELTGLEVTTFQGRYQARRFVIDGIRGRDVVEGRSSAPSSNDAATDLSGGLLGGIIGGRAVTAGSDSVRFDPAFTEQQRQSLDTTRQAAEQLYKTAEQASVRAAQNYHFEATQESPDEKALAQLKKNLQTCVASAFEAQMQLQQVRVQIAELDLKDVKSRQRRRQALAARIVERRVDDLISGEDLQWATSGTDNATGQPAADRAAEPLAAMDTVSDRSTQSDLQNRETQADPELDGEWKLLDITGKGIIGHEENLKLRTSAGKYVLVRPGSEHVSHRRINRDVKPFQIDIGPIDPSDAPPTFTGIYKVEGDRLSIAWAPADGSSPRPTDFSGSTGTVHSFQRIGPLPAFSTPQELVDYLQQPDGDDDAVMFDRYMEVMTDDEIDRYSGLMLRTVSMMQMAVGLYAALGTENGGLEAAEFVKMVGQMNLIVQKFKRDVHSPEAHAAYQEICTGINMTQLFQQNPPNPTGQKVGAAEYSKKLRTAAGVLTDSRQFLSEIMTAMQALATEQAESTDEGPQAQAPADWQIVVNGDTASAVNTSAGTTEPNALQLPPTMELVKVGNTWKISSLIPDKVILDIQQGFTVTDSSDAAGPSQPSVAPYAPAPVTGTIVAEAGRDLQAFSQLTSSDLSTTTVFSEEQIAQGISVDRALGQYVSRPVRKGEQITADLLIDKPSTDQIVNYWLGRAAEKTVVFTSPYCYLTVQSDRPNNIPYDTRYSAARFNDALPDCTVAYIAAVHDRLTATPFEQWSNAEINLLWSLADVAFFNTADNQRDLSTIGNVLHEFLTLEDKRLAAVEDIDVRKARRSALILGMATHINGSLPRQVLAAAPSDDATVSRLTLLQRMLENDADVRWISQEQIRLSGLLQDAPAAALKLLLTTAAIENRAHIERWIFALSTDKTYKASRSSPDEDFSPPLDPVVAVAVADLLAGQNQLTDDNIALLFEQHHPGYMLYRHLSDVLESEMAYREPVLDSLVRIYRKSTSSLLMDNIAKLAPAVPVMARETAKTTEILYFRADYSPPCRQMDALIAEFETSSVVPVHIVDITAHPEVAREYNVDRIPTVLLKRDGQEINRRSGLMSAEDLEALSETAARPADTEASTLPTGKRNQPVTQKAPSAEPDLND
ncbi:MAG: thioredoxin domain-containing protein [Fuerstiella sp.]